MTDWLKNHQFNKNPLFMGFQGHISDSIHNLIHSNCGQLFSPPFTAGTGLAIYSGTDNGPHQPDAICTELPPRRRTPQVRVVR
jgi:hypothetical protein